MKRIILIVFFCVFSVYFSGAQTSTSSQKKAQITEVSQPVVTTVQSSNTATLVSGERNSVIREVPLENQKDTTPIKSEIISTERKPQ